MGKSIADIKTERGIGGPPMLHGSDLPAKVNSVTIICRELREAPAQFKSPAIMDFGKPVYDKQCMAVNLTNLRILASLAGFSEDEADSADFDVIAKKCDGKKFTLVKTLVMNPKLGKMTPSLFFQS